MILGIGIDSVSVNRIDDLMTRFRGKFLQKIFVENEIIKAASIKHLQKEILFYAKRFAAKEAFSKAIGLGIGRGIDFQDIEIVNDAFGKPEIKILNDKKKFLKKHFKCRNFAIHLSLTDEDPVATAFVTIEKIS